MKLLRKIFFAVLLAMNVSSCEKDFVVKEQTDAKRMTVNCNFDNYRVFRVYLTQSSSLSGNSSLQPIPDARVELFENDSLIIVLPYVPTDTASTFGAYKSDFSPTPGNKYGIKITHPVYGIVIAEDVLLNLPQINYYAVESYGDYSTNSDVKFRFQLHDDGATEDYYRINLWQWGTQRLMIDSVWQTSDFSYGAKPELLCDVSDTVRDNGYFLLFSDKNFNGTDKEIKLHFWGVDSAFAEKVNAVVELQHVSKAHYEYYRTLELYQHSGYDAEPVYVYNNINNGYGIFMSSAINSMYVQVK